VLTQDLKVIRPVVAEVLPEIRTKSGARTGIPYGALACGVAVTMLLWAPDDAKANLQRKVPPKRVEAAKKEQPSPPKGPLIISISIASQHLTVYDQSTPIAHAPISTGMAGHATPMGVFSVIQKQRWHQSNIYSGAPMPFMQRITWSGVAMHAGVLPGYPASHGCIRMPYEFAVRLYGMTKMGARVFVTRNDVTPVAFTDPHLFTPKPQDDAQLVLPAAPAQASDRPVDTGSRVASADALVPLKTTESPAAVVVADASASIRSDDAIGAAKLDAPKLVQTPTEGTAPAGERTTVSEPKNAESTNTTANEPPKDGPVTIEPSASAGDTAVSGAPASAEPKSAEPKNTGPKNTEATPAVRTEPEAPAIIDASGSVGVVSQDGAAAKVDDSVAPVDIPIPQPRPQLASLKPGPISIFISKKLGKLFVRRAFESVFDSAVTIANPERSLGTHVFTATGFTDDHAAMRWLLVSLPSEAAKKEERADATRHKRQSQNAEKASIDVASAETAAGALERIEIPQDVRERIAELLTPGSSLVISDKDFGSETGASGETDFIVLTR
jgi:L,D-transpeptidase catalytic domain